MDRCNPDRSYHPIQNITKILGIRVIVAVCGAGLVLLSCQSSSDFPRINNLEIAPTFSLQDSYGETISLESIVSKHKYTVLLFYRGYF